MQNTLIHSIHQSLGVVMDKFLELVAEEIKFGANEILKDMQNKKKRPARPIHCPLNVLELSRLGNKIRETRLFRSAGLFQSYIYKFYDCDCSKTKIIKLNHRYLYMIYKLITFKLPFRSIVS